MDHIDLGIQTYPEDDDLPDPPKPPILAPAPRAPKPKPPQPTYDQRILLALEERTLLLRSIAFRVAVVMWIMLIPIVVSLAALALMIAVVFFGVAAATVAR